ncbi:MAG: hypothetical protein ACPG8O_10525 [Alcanivorax nanhaiticus]
MNTDITAAHKRMTLLWFMVLSSPMLIGIALAAMVIVGGYTAPAILIPEDQLRMGSLGAMALMLLCARPLRNWLLSPAAIAARPVQGLSANEDENANAAGKVQASMFLLLGILDAVSMIVVALSLMQADMQLAVLNGIYTLVLAIIAKPDFAELIKAVRQQLSRSA